MQSAGQFGAGNPGLFASQDLQQLMQSQKDRRKNCGRACFKCRQLRIKCDYQRPCHNCVKRGEDCKTDGEKMSCIHCRKSKLKCDKQKPCSRCVKRGNPDDCVSQVNNGVPEKFRPKPQAQNSNELNEQDAGQLLVPASSHMGSMPSMVFAQASMSVSDFSSLGVQQQTSRKRAFCEIYTGEEEEPEVVEDHKTLQVGRPLMHESKKLRLLDTSRVRHEVSATIKHRIMQRMWEAGYSKDSLERLFQVLPRGLKCAMDEGLSALETLSWIKAQQAKLLGASAPALQTPSASGYVTPATMCQTPLHAYCSAEAEEVMEVELSVNDVYDQLGCGWWSLTFDPATGRRTALEVNHTLAKMLHMHPEELLARAGHSDVGLPCSQLEFCCTILDDLCNAGEQRLVRYSTVTAELHGRVVETMLVRRETYREFSPEGKFVRIQHLLFRVSEEEYDAAFRSDPSVCRPFFSVMGDFRGGADILADAPRDLLFEEQLATMQQTEEGLKKLRRVEALLRVRFEPVLQYAQKAKAKFAQAIGEKLMSSLSEEKAEVTVPWTSSFSQKLPWTGAPSQNLSAALRQRC